MRANLKQKIPGQRRMRAPEREGIAAERCRRRRGRAHRSRRHYDIGNDLYTEARRAHGLHLRLLRVQGGPGGNLTRRGAKLYLVCRKVGMKPGMRVLDLGCVGRARQMGGREVRLRGPRRTRRGSGALGNEKWKTYGEAELRD